MFESSVAVAYTMAIRNLAGGSCCYRFSQEQKERERERESRERESRERVQRERVQRERERWHLLRVMAMSNAMHRFCHT